MPLALAASAAARITAPGTDAGRVAAVSGSVTFAVAVLTPLLIVATGIRVLAHPSLAPMPVNAARATLASVTATLYCSAIGAGAVLIGSVSSVSSLPTGRSTGDASIWTPLALLLIGAGLNAAAARSLRRARSSWAQAFGSRERLRNASRPDLLDDLSTLVARWLPGSATARAGAWLNRGFDVWAWSPRRHRTGFVAACAGFAGVTLTGWQSVTAGPWSGPLALLTFAALVSLLVAAALGAGIAWLGLLRPLAE